MLKNKKAIDIILNMKKLKENIFNLILIAILIFLFFICKKQLVFMISCAKRVEDFKFIFPFVNNQITNDTFFTLAMGRDILQNGIQYKEILTWHNLQFSNPRWLYDVFLTIFFGHFGMYGIYIYTIVMSVISLVLVFFVSYKMNKSWKVSLIYTLLAWFACRSCFYARAWQFSFIFIILEYYFLQKLIEEGRLRFSVFIVILGLLIANMHASVFPIYLVMFLPYIAEEILYKLHLKIPKLEIEEVDNFKKLIITFFISCVIGILNPFGLLPYTYMLKNMAGFSKEIIGELAPSTWENNKEFFITLLITLLAIVKGKQKVKIVDIFYILGFAILTKATFRSFYYFVYISGMVISRILYDFFTQNEWNINKYLKWAVTLAGGTLFTIVMLIDCFRAMDVNLIPKEDYPIKLADYILDNVNTEDMRLFNGFNYGSYLEFKGIKTFIDSRSEVFCEEFNPGCTVLKDWYLVYTDAQKYESVFEKYNITHAIAKDSENLSILLEEDENWKLIYSDETWYLFEKVK